MVNPPTSKLLRDFTERGLVHDVTAGLDQRLVANPAISAYIGFDPSANSLHVGHLMGVLALRRLQLHGGRPVALVGGGTGMIGDPSGRSSERNLLDRATLDQNRAAIGAQLANLVDFTGSNGALLLDNLSWLGDLGLIDFLRDTGKHLTVGYMLAKESVKTRLDGGLSYTEFSYMLLQSYDFMMLRKLHGVELQMGGSDQWGNITAGTELIRRTEGEHPDGAPRAYGLCYPLLLAKSGAKFGKTAEGAVWLDPTRTSPFAFRQFWMEQDDDAVASLLARFTLESGAETAALMARHTENPAARRAQRHLARSVTSMVHGADLEARAAAVADALFGNGEGGAPDVRGLTGDALAMLANELPSSTLPTSEEATLTDLVIAAGFGSSKGEARRLIEQGGISVNGEPAPNAAAATTTFAPLADGSLLLRKGRRDYRLLRRP
jgi:tyrosyl-tRNA synthetase